MFKNSYLNFVKASEGGTLGHEARTSTISGIEAQRMYLEELKDTSKQTNKNVDQINENQSIHNLSNREDIHVSDKYLFFSVQNNDVETLIPILNAMPDKLNVLDDYGWSLLMVACQANAADVVKELLDRGIDTFVRDKAGNSACSLVNRNRNYMLADILYTYKKKVKQPNVSEENTQDALHVAEQFLCEICNSTFPDKTEHLSSTVHNINASKGKKVPSHYVIPQTNKGYQLLLKVGWDRESGLGKDGAGKKYPIKAIQKKDRKGLRHETKRETQSTENHVQYKNRRKAVNDYNRNKRLEIKFRREFY